MAAELVTAEQYPDLETFELTSELGERAGFLGRITAQGQSCTACGTSDTVIIYRGPQYGLAFDVPETPFTVAPVDLELAWCSRHGSAGMRLLDHDGAEHTGL